MIEAALFQLRAVAAEVDPSLAPQLSLCVGVLARAVEAAGGDVNAARVADIEFALSDLAAAVDELPPSHRERLLPLLTAIREDVEALKVATALEPALIEQIRAFEWTLRDQMKAIERQTYVEGGTETPLPHPPAELRKAALPIRQALDLSGFLTPALDELIASPESLRYHSIREILDELEVIAG